jgi:glutaminase
MKPAWVSATMSLTEQRIRAVIDQAATSALTLEPGTFPTYIPSLASQAPHFAVAYSGEGTSLTFGDHSCEFSLQSVAKLFLVAVFLEIFGVAKLSEIFALKFHDSPYHSLLLEPETNRPFDPMRNTGAMVIASYLAAHFGSFEELHLYTRKGFSGDFEESPEEADAALAVGYRNKAIAYYLASLGQLAPSTTPEQALEFYYRACFWRTSVSGLACSSSLAWCRLPKADRSMLFSLLERFGMYGYSPRWLDEGGFRAKSSVSGLIVMPLPNLGSLVVYAPGLDRTGNSVRGSQFCRDFARRWRELT